MNHQLQRYIEDHPSSEASEPTSEPPEPWALEGRWTPEQIAELVAAYNAGATSRQLADQHGVGKTAIVRLLRRHGVEIRKRGSRPS